MSVQIMKHYISPEEAEATVNNLQNRLTPEPREGMSSALGQKNSLQASKVSLENPAVELGSDENENKSILFISDVVNKIRKTIEDFYETELDLINMSLSRIEQGGFNSLHSDNSEIDGSPRRPDGIEEVEYSALLYMTDFGKDFFGGEIFFPQHDLEIKPEKGMLVFFKGDHHHIHEVKSVTGGARYTLVLFYGLRGNLSAESIFL